MYILYDLAMEKRIIAIGGGEIKVKETLEIDRFIAAAATARAGDKRATALFLGTASHDSMPYFNSFRKTYTSVFDIKAEVGLLVYGEMDDENIRNKFLKADMIYVGGGDTAFCIDIWRKRGIDKLLSDAYERGVILCGLSAGAICWFKNLYSDYDIMRGQGSDYKVFDGLAFLPGIACPHYEQRPEFDQIAAAYDSGYAFCGNSAAEFVDGELTDSIGRVYVFEKGIKKEAPKKVIEKS